MGFVIISWSTRKQGSIAQSTTEAEYIAASDAYKEEVWIKKILNDVFGGNNDSMIIHCDNQSCIKLSENPVFHDRLKHIEMRYHVIRDLVQRGALKLQYIRTDEQIADILAKPLIASKFVYFSDKIGMAENASLAEREC